MAASKRQGVEVKKSSPGLFDQHAALFGVFAQNMAQAAEVQKSLVGLATSCATNIVESAVAVQAEVARMSLDAILHGDPAALMALGQRAARAGFRETMDCASRNLQAAQSLGAHVLDAVSTPAGGNSGNS